MLTLEELGLHKALYSVGETAQLLTTSRDAVYALDKAGKPLIHKTGPKKSRIFAADLAIYLNDLRKQRAAREPATA